MPRLRVASGSRWQGAASHRAEDDFVLLPDAGGQSSIFGDVFDPQADTPTDVEHIEELEEPDIFWGLPYRTHSHSADYGKPFPTVIDRGATSSRPKYRSHSTFTSQLEKGKDMAASAGSGQPTGVSPSSSPRLPSPPPFTEVQIGPKSPSVSDRGEDKLFDNELKHDHGATRRIRPGTKAEEMASGPPLIPLSQLDSPFQLQEHLKALYHTYTKAATSSSTTPVSRETAVQLANPPESIDRHLWLYELCRFLTMKANNLIIAFFAENPPCSAITCPEMRASEWQYLCAVHDPPKSCCAIDYCCHTLDWATNILTSPKYFPSRLTLGSEAAGGPAASMRHLTNIFRRVYRIFAHAWFQHRGVFWEVESHDGLYVFFKTVCDIYQLIPEDNYTIPAEAEGIESDMVTPMNTESPDLPGGPKMSILKPGTENGHVTKLEGRDEAHGRPEVDVNATAISTGATTRRHKHTPSTGSQVTTIAEGREEDEDEEDGNHSTAGHPSHRTAHDDVRGGETEFGVLGRARTVTNLAESSREATEESLKQQQRVEGRTPLEAAQPPSKRSTNEDKEEPTLELTAPPDRTDVADAQHGEGDDGKGSTQVSHDAVVEVKEVQPGREDANENNEQMERIDLHEAEPAKAENEDLPREELEAE